MLKHILVTGANGQLGRELQALVKQYKYELNTTQFYFKERSDLDITDSDTLKEIVESLEIDTIINCAAYTAVDKAEREENKAVQVNKEAVENLANIAKEKDILLIHISTDYVFDGVSHLPFREDDLTNPQGIYGKTKLAGEDAIRSINPKHTIILRASWIYSNYGANFVNTMLKLGSDKKNLRVVCDQIGTPTYARDLADAILAILSQYIQMQKIEEGVHVYHYSNEGSCSWYDFVKAIFEIQHIKCKVDPITSDEYPTQAKRPHYSVLNKEKIKQRYGLEIPYWRDSLEKCLALSTHKREKYSIGIIGSGFIAGGLAKLLAEHDDYEISAILTRSILSKREAFAQNRLLTNDLNDLIENSDLIVECTGDALYATETIDQIVKANIPVVTMNSEFHVTTGSYFVDKGFVTEAEGDQPGVQAILHEEAIAMGFNPLAYVNIKGFLNENPSRKDMAYWGERSNLSLEMVTSFTDGTKVSIEQVLVANGLGAGIIQDGLLKLKSDDMLEGGTVLAEKAKSLGYPVSDYVLSATLPAGVFVIAEHKEEQADSLRYYKLGEGPYYVIERTYHLCHLEIVKTIKRVLDGGTVLLDNSREPRFSVAAVAKKDLKAGLTIDKGIGSFDVRGIAVGLAEDMNHVPIGLLVNATLKKDIKEGERIRFEDVELPESLALEIWKKILATVD